MKKFKDYDDFLINLVKNIDPANEGFISYEQLVLGFRKMGIELSY